MNIMDIMKNLRQGSADKSAVSLLAIEKEIKSGLSLYFSKAKGILQGSGVGIIEPGPEFYSFERNFFSAIFVYSYQRAGISDDRRIFYAAINQCLRGMVTGCDNILDNEYKKTLDYDLPEKGTKFRSIMDIMVSDRVLFELLLDICKKGEIDYDQVVSASRASLRALAQSGAQEAEEEEGIADRLSPEETIRKVHHYKTGLLFESPYAVPSVIEKLDNTTASDLKKALYDIGIGCQIMDDMVDLPADILNKRHNYVASLICLNPSDKARINGFSEADPASKESLDLLFGFPEARSASAKLAIDTLTGGFQRLFAREHQHLVKPSILFLAERLTARRFLSDILND